MPEMEAVIPADRRAAGKLQTDKLPAPVRTNVSKARLILPERSELRPRHRPRSIPASCLEKRIADSQSLDPDADLANLGKAADRTVLHRHIVKRQRLAVPFYLGDHLQDTGDWLGAEDAT